VKTILAIETSSPVLSVALGTREGWVRELRSRTALKHSENLIPLIDRLLKKEKLSLKQIDAFAIDRGPGSFTGLRIGFSLLKGFLAVRKRPCYGALSLDMMPEKIRLPEGSRLGVLIDARRGAVYSRFYRLLRGQWVPEQSLRLLSLSQLKTQIREGTVLVEEGIPSARTLVRWVQTGDNRIFRLKSPRDFLPLYLRASEAEENRRKSKQHGR